MPSPANSRIGRPMPCQGAVAFIGIAVKADVLEREVLERCEQRCTHTLQVSIAVNNRSRPPSRPAMLLDVGAGQP
jgi:hypothetical protein